MTMGVFTVAAIAIRRTPAMDAAPRLDPKIRVGRNDVVGIGPVAREIEPEHFTPRGVKCSPCRADFVGASRDKVGLGCA